MNQGWLTVAWLTEQGRGTVMSSQPGPQPSPQPMTTDRQSMSTSG